VLLSPDLWSGLQESRTIARLATQSVAVVHSHAERGNEKTGGGDAPARLKPNSEPSTLNPAMAQGGKRKKKVETVYLVCEETGDHNYTLRRKMGGEKLKLKKYSPRLRKHTMHTEKKK
jgi:large subunit ribosomal protein L33